MKKINLALCSVTLVFSTLASAEEADWRMEEFKQKLTQHIDKEIEILTQFKTCIQSAKTRPDLESCKDAKNEAQKKNMSEMKKERLENQKNRLANREKQLNEAAAKVDKK